MVDKLYAQKGGDQGITLESPWTTFLYWDGTAWGEVYLVAEMFSGETGVSWGRNPNYSIAPLDRILVPGTPTPQYAGGKVGKTTETYLYKWVPTDPPTIARVATHTAGVGELAGALSNGSTGAYLSILDGHSIGNYSGSGFTWSTSPDTWNFDSVSGEITNWVPQAGGASIQNGVSTLFLGKLRLELYAHSFRHGGYIWTVWGQCRYWHRVSGFLGNYTLWVGALTRTTPPAAGTLITKAYFQANTKIMKIFTPYHTAAGTNADYNTWHPYSTPNTNTGQLKSTVTPPVYWPNEDCYFICLAKGTMYDTGAGWLDGDDHDLLYLLKSDGTIHTALTMTFPNVGGLNNSALGGGVYYHEATQKIYCAYFYGTNIKFDSGETSTTAWLNIYRLDSYNLTASPPTFTWTLVQGDVYGFPITGTGASRVSPSGMFSMTADASHLFIHWVAQSAGRIHRLNVATEVISVDTLPTGWGYQNLSFTKVRIPPPVIRSLGAGIIG